MMWRANGVTVRLFREGATGGLGHNALGSRTCHMVRSNLGKPQWWRKPIAILDFASPARDDAMGERDPSRMGRISWAR